MLKRPTSHQTELELVTLESLVPADHLLRKIEAAIDFGFICDLTDRLFCPDKCRLPVASEILFKAFFIGYLFGIRSERQLMREIEVNVAYRWFLELRMTDRVFDARTFNQARTRNRGLFGHKSRRTITSHRQNSAKMTGFVNNLKLHIVQPFLDCF